VYAKRTLFFAIPDGAYPPSRHVPVDVSRPFLEFSENCFVVYVKRLLLGQ
jgi:hypothetical protein